MSDPLAPAFPRTRRGWTREVSGRGYFGVVAWHTKTPTNVGTLWRSAHVFGAAFLATVGRRYRHQQSDTLCTPRHVPLLHFDDDDDFWRHIPFDCVPVAVELVEDAATLATFQHPRSAVYLLGPEDGSLPRHILDRCRPRHLVQIPGVHCLNLAVAGSIVMYDRVVKAAWGGLGADTTAHLQAT